MDPMMAVAVVVASVVTHAWGQSKRRAALGWQAAREGRARRDATRRARRADWAQRVDTARQTGPRNPLWWPYAVGFVAVGVARAAVAAGQGAREGARMGAEEGHRFGRAASERGWKWRRAWREYRQRTTPAGERSASDDVVLEACPACGVYTAVTSLVPDPELGRVCGPCAQWRAGEQPSGGGEPANASAGERCDGRCTNSDIGLEEARARGLCAGCGGRGDLVWNFGDEHSHLPCRECNPDGQGWKRPRAETSEANRDHSGDMADSSSWLSPDAARWSPELAADAENRHTDVTNPGYVWHLVRLHWADGSTQEDAIRGRDRADVEANARWRWTDGPVTPTSVDYLGLDPKTSGYVMPGLCNNQPGGTMTTALTTGTGEGYTDTVTTLQTLARQLTAAYDTAQRLDDQLTADELDADTLIKIADLLDILDTAPSLTVSAARHVQQRHAPVAAAVASAGGSGNVARKGWYDDV